MRIGISADHGGFELKQLLVAHLADTSHEVVDFGPASLNTEDDYPDYVIPMAQAVSANIVERGVAVCGSGVGACIAADKVKGVRAALILDVFSAHQGVEDDDMNVICLGGRVLGPALAIELVDAFLRARFSGKDRHKRRIAKVQRIERNGSEV